MLTDRVVKSISLTYTVGGVIPQCHSVASFRGNNRQSGTLDALCDKKGDGVATA
jgi:hypothetical protein